MPPPSPIKLSQPLRDVKIVRSGDRQALLQQDLQASYERGRLDGERSLSEQLIRQRSAVVELQNGILTSLRNAVPQVIRDTENALVELALQVAQKIVADVPIDAAMVKASVQEAIAQAADTTELTIQLHPADLALLQANQSPLLDRSENKNIQFVPATQVSRGGCVVQTRFGIVDARRETRVELLRNALQLAPGSAEPPKAASEPAGETRAVNNPVIVAPSIPESARQTEPEAEQKILQP